MVIPSYHPTQRFTKDGQCYKIGERVVMINNKFAVLVSLIMSPERNDVGEWPISRELVIFNNKNEAVNFFYRKVDELGFDIQIEDDYNGTVFAHATGFLTSKFDHNEKASVELQTLFPEGGGVYYGS